MELAVLLSYSLIVFACWRVEFGHLPTQALKWVCVAAGSIPGALIASNSWLLRR